MSKAVPYRCNDCKVFFTVYSKRRAKIGCPLCHDYVSVVRHKGRIGVLNPGNRTEWPDEKEKQLIELLKTELFHREIADIMGVSFGSVRSKVVSLRKQGKIL